MNATLKEYANMFVVMSVDYLAGGIDDVTYAINIDLAVKALGKDLIKPENINKCKCGAKGGIWSSVTAWVECGSCGRVSHKCATKQEAVLRWNNMEPEATKEHNNNERARK